MLRHKRMLFQFVQHLLPTSSLSEDNTCIVSIFTKRLTEWCILTINDASI